MLLDATSQVERETVGEVIFFFSLWLAHATRHKVPQSAAKPKICILSNHKSPVIEKFQRKPGVNDQEK